MNSNNVIDFGGMRIPDSHLSTETKPVCFSDSMLQLCRSLLRPCMCLSLSLSVSMCVCLCAYTWKVMFQQSRVMFNLLSQKAFNPFHTVILLILVPKWLHLDEKSALSPTNTIKLTIGSYSLLFWKPSSQTVWHTHVYQCISIVVRTVTELSQCNNQEPQH